MLFFLIQFTMLENVNRDLQKVTRMKKAIDVYIGITLLKYFIQTVKCYFLWFSLVCLTMWTVTNHRFGEW